MALGLTEASNRNISWGVYVAAVWG
jgi:hypothetical protein